MINLSNSSVLILSSAVFSFSHPTLAIVAFSLGVTGAFISYCVHMGERQSQAKEAEDTKENISSIISGLASGLSDRDRNNLH